MFKYIVKISIILFTLCVFCISCSPSKRLNHLLNRHAELTKDTNYIVRDTFITHAYHFDTLYNFKHIHDTVFINKDNVITKIFTHNDTLFLNTFIKSDTIHKTITLPVKKIINTIEDKKRWTFLAYGLAIAFAFIIVIQMLLKYFKIF
jgi:hypothetical protein